MSNLDRRGGYTPRRAREQLEQLGFSDDHDALIVRYREQPSPMSELLTATGPSVDSQTPWDDVGQRGIADSTVRRVLADL